jgi:hypothetical protein
LIIPGFAAGVRQGIALFANRTNLEAVLEWLNQANSYQNADKAFLKESI